MPTSNPTSIRTLAVSILLPALLGAGAARAAEVETWSGTWNAPNLWRAVEWTVQPGVPEATTYAVGTAREKVAVSVRSFASDDTSMTAELDYAGTTVHLEGRLTEGTAEGSLQVVRGDVVLSKGSWTSERRSPSDRSVDRILDDVRRALRFPGALAGGYTIEETPAGGDVAGVPAWSAGVGAHGEILIREDGAPALLHDGSGFRMARGPFGWMPVDARMQEKTLLAEVVRSGAWLVPGSTWVRTAWTTGEGSARRYVLGITAEAGVVPARVVIDPATWLPESAAAAWDAGDRSFRFADYTEMADVLVPREVTSVYRGREQTLVTSHVRAGVDPFPAPAGDGVGYDLGASPVLEGTHGADDVGHLFVRPTVAGRDIGWFHVDTGAPFLILDAETADDLGLEVLREMGPRTIRRLPEIRIGQLILRDQPVLVQDLSDFSAPDSSRRAGVIGGPAFEHATVIFDYSGRRLSVFAPDAFRERVDWQPLSVEGAPVITALLNGVPGRFVIDTGKSGTASLLSHAAARDGLFDRRRLEEAANETVEGTTIELVTHVGSITVGGRRFDDPEIRIKLPGTTNDEIGTVAGIVGRGLFADRRVVFDYAGGRIGLLP